MSGLVSGLLLVAVSFVPAEEATATGAVLCGFAQGWATLSVHSTRLAGQPQAWALGPAMFMGLGGLLLLVFGASVDPLIRWGWPPALLGLVVWMVLQTHRRLRSRRWLLYPVIVTMTVAAVGGGYETVSAADPLAKPSLRCPDGRST